MSLVVPFDGSELSKTALVRAAQFDMVLDRGVVALSVIPRNNAVYARKKGWLGPNQSFDLDRITSHLQDSVHDIAPDAEFHAITVDRWARVGSIAKKIRRFARENETSIVFIGSENAGRIVQSISVGSSVATDRSYDTMIVSNPAPTPIGAFEEAVSTEQSIDVPRRRSRD
jgi:nucleotide-binding universal stress UspA family protein